MDEGNSWSPGSSPPLSPLVLPRVPKASLPSWSVPVGPLNPLGRILFSEGIARRAHMVEASSPFLCLSGLDKMIPERLVLGPLSFWFPLGGGLHHQDL